MSQCDPTDLLCRRAELTADEQRRLRANIQFSLEVRLMSEILPEFERESRVRPGDDLLVARINARALAALGARSAPLRAPAKRRMLMLLVAAAVLLVAGLAGAWLGGARRSAPAPAPAADSATVKPALKLKPIAKPKPSAVIEPVTPIVPLEELEPLAPSPPTSASASPIRELKAVAPEPASELFTRANRLRRQGRAGEAAVLYELLLDQYPNAREVGPTRLALGKYLQAKQPERALVQYRALAGAGGALRAEALWGISELATARGERAVAEQALADLLREFPDSPYAEVARERAAHDRR